MREYRELVFLSSRCLCEINVCCVDDYIFSDFFGHTVTGFDYIISINAVDTYT